MTNRHRSKLANQVLKMVVPHLSERGVDLGLGHRTSTG